MLVLAMLLLAANASDDAYARRGSSGGSGHSARSSHSARPAPAVRPGPSTRPAPSAHSGHFTRHAPIGIFLGAPLFAPLYFPPSGYYYNPSLPSSPPVYIEQESATDESAPEPYYWYYCIDSNTYYPYVEECPGGWQQVVPQTPPPS